MTSSESVRGLLRRYPVASFLVIAFAWSWPLAAMIERSLLAPLAALFGPLIGALLVLYARHGALSLAALVLRFRPHRAALRWSLFGVLLAVVLLVPIWLLQAALAGSIPFRLTPITGLSLALALLIVGEEVGWRGFLLPRLLERQTPLVASLAVGAVWALWHLPNFFLPGFPHRGLPFPAFLLLLLAYSVFFTLIHLETGGSLLAATAFHAALNLFGLDGIPPAREYWLRAAVFTAAAVVALLAARRRFAGGRLLW